MTFRELAIMARHRSLVEWDRAASIIAMIAEIHRDREARSMPFDLTDFHPLRMDRSETDDVIEVDLRIFKPMIVGR